MTIKFLEVNQDVVDEFGEEITVQIEKNIEKIKDAAEFIQKTYNKYGDPDNLEIAVYLDNESIEDLFSLRITAGEKVCVLLEWNLEEIGKVTFTEFPCYDENDSIESAKLRENYYKNTKLQEDYSNDTKNNYTPSYSGPARISP